MSRPGADRRLRVFYAAGPGDVAGTFRCWRDGRDDPSQVARTYSGQFFDACRSRNAEALVIACSPRPARASMPGITVEHRAVPWSDRGGVLFHLGQVWYGLVLLIAARRFRADVAIVSMGTHWFMLSLFNLLRIQVVPSLHCVLWPTHGERPSGLQRLLLRMARPLFRRHATAILSLSAEIDEQVRLLGGAEHRPIVSFLPSYRRDAFAGLAETVPPRSPFRLLYAGRIERNKGPFDLLEVLRRLREDGAGDVEFDLCGDGSALDELRAAATDAGLADVFRCHGHCDRTRMRELFAASHVVVVPTTTAFIEGFNKVVAEGILAGRPVVTSVVCPAVAYVRDAVVTVPPDEIGAYVDAIRQLRDDSERYEAVRAACREVAEQFYDISRGWGAGLTRVLDAALERRDPEPVSWLQGPSVAGKASA